MIKHAYYNERDPLVAEWLRNLVRAGLVAPGYVDERDIHEVEASDLRGFRQHHFFAWVGVWSHALRLAGWDDDREVWTGSCPCQPFSVAGAKRGIADERHLWPEFFRLIRECRPPVIVGEQVSGPAALAWFDALSNNLEGAGYAVGAANLCACSVGGPHIRQRLYWLANNERNRRQGSEHTDAGQRAATMRRRSSDGGDSTVLGLANSECASGRAEQLYEPRKGLWREAGTQNGAGTGERGCVGGLANASPRRLRIDGSASGNAGHAPQCDSARRMGDSSEPRSRRDAGTIPSQEREGDGEWGAIGHLPDQLVDASSNNRLANPNGGEFGDQELQRSRRLVQLPENPLADFWADAEWIACSDGKARPVEPGTFPLAHGITARVGRLRAYGNALCAPVAEAFVRATMECLDSRRSARPGGRGRCE